MFQRKIAIPLHGRIHVLVEVIHMAYTLLTVSRMFFKRVIGLGLGSHDKHNNIVLPVSKYSSI